MSRTRKGGKEGGYDFWSRRPHSGNGYGKHAKQKTKETERMAMCQMRRELLTTNPFLL